MSESTKQPVDGYELNADHNEGLAADRCRHSAQARTYRSPEGTVSAFFTLTPGHQGARARRPRGKIAAISAIGLMRGPSAPPVISVLRALQDRSTLAMQTERSQVASAAIF